MNIQFPAFKSNEGIYDVYTSIVRFSDLVALFKGNEEYKHARERSQRVINLKRAKVISEYIAGSIDWVLPAFMAATDSSASFEAIPNPLGSEIMGIISIPFNSTRSLWDGQHRKTGISILLESEESNKFSDFTVTIKFYIGLTKVQLQQAFSDVNQRAVKPTSALGLTFNSRDPLPILVKSVLDRSPDMGLKVDYEKSTPSGSSICLWSIKGVESAVKNIIGMSEKDYNEVSKQEENVEKLTQLCVDVFSSFSSLPYWNDAIKNTMSASDVRGRLLIGQVVFLEALSIWFKCVSHQWIENQNKDWSLFERLVQVNPRRDHEDWKGRCVNIDGTMNKTKFGVYATAAQLCRITDIPMTRELAAADEKLSQLQLV